MAENLIQISWNPTEKYGTFTITSKSGKSYELFTTYSKDEAEENDIFTAVFQKVLDNVPFGMNNNFKESAIRKYLEEKILPDLADDEGLITQSITTNLESYFPSDGNFGVLESYISIPTAKFYRNHEKIFKKFTTEKSWWLATPHGVDGSSSNSSIFVAPSKMIIEFGDGDNNISLLNFTSSLSSCGVRPIICLYPSEYEWVETE